MDASGLGSIRGASDAHARERRQVGRQHLIAAGGILGALAASSCCIVPLVLFGLGIGGAWIGNLTALWFTGSRGEPALRTPPACARSQTALSGSRSGSRPCW